MTLYTVTGTFSNGAALSGTLDITADSVLSADLSAASIHFTNIYQAWHIITTPDYSTWGLSLGHPVGDFLTFTYQQIFPAPQWRITGGSVDHFDTAITYYGIGLSGTICPLEGCAPFPSLVRVPGPVAGAGEALTLILIAALLWRKLHVSTSR